MSGPDRSTIRAGIGEIARGALGRKEPLAESDRLIEDLELDSLQLFTLAVEVENRFEICLDEDEEAAIATVGDLVDAVAAKLAAKGRG